MWRSVWMAIGITLCIIGSECLVFEQVVLADPQRPAQTSTSFTSQFYSPQPARRVVVPPEWAPWVLLASGVILILYTSSSGGD